MTVDPEQARALFEGLGQIHLVAISEDGAVAAHDFGDNVDEAVGRAVERNARGANVYFTVNAVRPGLNRKPVKSDVTAARFCHVDLDPPKDDSPWSKSDMLERLAYLPCPPSFIIDSGGGLQAFWRLSEPCENWQHVEVINRGIRDALGGDACWNADRLMRVPGLTNYPDARKRARGRVPALATIAVADDGVLYVIDELAAAYPEKIKIDSERATVDAPDDIAFLSADDLGLGEFDPIRSAIEHPPGRDHSGDLLACARLMANLGFSDAQIFGTLLNPTNPISFHAHKQRDPRRTVLRVIEKVRASSKPRAEAAGPSRPAYLNGTSARALMTKSFPPMRAVVPGMLAAGVTILGGRPKTRKSFLALDLASAVATGDKALGTIPVEVGDVLFLALEDGQRRLQMRLDMRGDEDGSERLIFVTEWPTLDEGCIAEIAAWADAVEKPALVVVDVLKQIRSATRQGESIYDSDYRALAGLAAFGRERGIAVLVVHHTRKLDADDPLDSLSGTTGLAGAADSIMVLKRNSTAKTEQAKLHIRGRDIEQSELILVFDPEHAQWRLFGSAGDVGRTAERRQILELLVKSGDMPLTVKEISDRTGKRYDAVRMTCARMWRDGEITRLGRGLYIHTRSFAFSPTHSHTHRTENECVTRARAREADPLASDGQEPEP
jgi:hypothetical protein